jgi:hypothetical protein
MQSVLRRGESRVRPLPIGRRANTRFATTIALVLLLLLCGQGLADEWHFKKEFVAPLVQHVPKILKTQDKSTGRFGTGIWIVTDQNQMYPLAAAWSINDPANPYYHSPEVLEAIMSAGDALIADMRPDGMWEFRKKDGSTWGDIYMPWTYSRWIRAFSLIKDAMPTDRRAKWEKAMLIGFDGIAKTETIKPMQNIPVHNCMGLYLASKIFNKPEWEKAAVDYLHKCVEAQHPDGYWTEHSGPVVMYNGVYVDALGTYYGMSHDPLVLPALQRSAHFHAAMTYPDGRAVETVDERNPYHDTIAGPNLGFSFSPEGRAYCRRQIERLGSTVGPEVAASFILYGEEGDVAPEPKSGDMYLSGDKQAMTRQQGPWFTCLTSYTADLSEKRWIQDRQNFFSLYRDGLHVIVGGGNTKLQPLWSTFTVGDVALLKHKGGDENPNFIPPSGLKHTPASATLHPDQNSVDLDYGDAKCSVSVDISDPAKAKLVYELKSPGAKDVAAHVTLLPQLKQKWSSASGKGGTLSDEPIALSAGEAGAWLAHRGFKISLPPQASVNWPVLPHNPYTKDGHAETSEGRIVITLPFSADQMHYELIVEPDEK